MLNTIRNICGMMTGNNFALSGLLNRGSFVTQGSASPQAATLHPGLRVLRHSVTKIHGIDGLIFFHDDKSGAKWMTDHPRKIVVSVKGGENVNVTMVRDLKGVVDREKAAMGFFVTLAEPAMTDHGRPMLEEAVSAGFYDAPRFGSEYPKLQILTIEGLMNGTERPRFPDPFGKLRASLTLGRSTFKRAAVEDMGAEQEKLL